MENILSFEELNENLNEAKGVHPAIKATLVKFIKNNPNCKYADAKRHIAKAVKGWELTKEDFDECMKECKGKDGKESKEDAKQAFFDSKKKSK